MQNGDSARAAIISGSPSRSSRSKVLLEHAAAQLSREGVVTVAIELAALPADDLLGRTRSPAIVTALAEVAAARIVIAGTPVYRASYSGLLKVFFDLLPANALVGKIGIPIATGGSASHQLVLDHGLRPLFASLGAVTVPSATYGVESQFTSDGVEPLLLDRLTQAVNEALLLARALQVSGSTTL